MAWAEKMSSGRFRGGYRDPDGRKLYVTDGGRGYERKKDAKAVAQECEVRARRRAAVDEDRLLASITWGEWWDMIADAKTTDSDTDTARVVRGIVRAQLRPKWGTVPLNKIRHKLVKKWVEEEELKVRPRMSAEYVHRIFGLFNWSIKRAVDAEVLDASPCAGIKLPKRPDKSRAYISVPRAAKMGKFLREDYRDAVAFMLETGLRPGELCGLHADRVDFDTGWLEVVEVFVTGRRLIKPCPKDHDVRKVALSSKAVEIIRRRLGDRDLAAGCGQTHSDDTACHSPLVFLTVRGRVMSPKTLSAHITNASTKAKVTRQTAYAGRRGWFTRLAEGGLDPFAMAAQGGHSDVKQTTKYVQVTAATRARTLAALGETPQLTVIEGQRGATRGADLAVEPMKDSDIPAEEDAG
jgi:integrase